MENFCSPDCSGKSIPEPPSLFKAHKSSRRTKQVPVYRLNHMFWTTDTTTVPLWDENTDTHLELLSREQQGISWIASTTGEEKHPRKFKKRNGASLISVHTNTKWKSSAASLNDCSVNVMPVWRARLLIYHIFIAVRIEACGRVILQRIRD